jgi:hypothetical protein
MSKDRVFSPASQASQAIVPVASRLSGNAGIESGSHLFQEDGQPERLALLRQKAADVMDILQRFDPYLSGAVLDGTAGPDAGIDIQLFTDNVKEVEIFLINRRIEYRHEQPRSERAEAVLSFHDGDTAINLVVYSPREERVVFRARDGRVRPRARLAAVRRLLSGPDEAA